MAIRELVEAIIRRNTLEAEKELSESMGVILRSKLVEFKKIVAAKQFYEEAEPLEEASNTIKQGRTKIIRLRVRNGKVQRRKKLSAVKGYTLRRGKLTRMSATERRRRKMGARKAKVKRRSKRTRIRMKLRRSLRKRKTLGIK